MESNTNGELTEKQKKKLAKSLMTEEEKLKRKELQIYQAAAQAFLDEEEDVVDESDTAAHVDLHNGKVLPSVEGIVNFNFFNNVVKLKQDTHSCGGHLWRSATILLNYMENKSVFPDQASSTNNDNSNSSPKNFFAGKKIIELGSGTGLVGVALAKIGADVTVTDQEFLVPLMIENAKLNDVDMNLFHAKELWWYASTSMHNNSLRGKTDCAPFREPPIDYILAADCIYLEPAFEPLVQTLWDLSSPETVIIVSYIKRRKADRRFWTKAQKKFDTEKVSVQQYSNQKGERVQIFHLKKKTQLAKQSQPKNENTTTASST